MTNFEWLLENHEDLVKEAIVNCLAVTKDGPCRCSLGVNCGDCMFYNGAGYDEWCNQHRAAEWLDGPHEEYMIPADTPIDTKVLVSDNNKSWHQRYFAGFEKIGSKIFYKAFADGATLWSVEDIGTVNWEYCKLAE